MGRKRDRSSAMGLLPRMEARPWSDGKTITYRYHPVGGKPIPLGTNKELALRKVLDLTGERDSMGTLAWVWEKYTESSPKWIKLTDGTKDDYRLAWKQINAVLGQMHIAEITSTIVSRYVHIERAGSPRRADIEKSVLSRLFGHGIKLGVCTVNATIGVEPHGGEARTEAPDPAILAKFLDWVMKQTPQRRIIAMAAKYSSLAGNRQVEFRPLTWPQVDFAQREIRIIRAKQRGKKREQVIERIAMSDDLYQLMTELRALNKERDTDCLYVFPTRDNNQYTKRGFQTLWQRCVTDAIAEGVLKSEHRFTFHDLRAYYATMHKVKYDELPDLHKNPETTARVYDRNKIVARRAI